jgi:hypothetical protein
VLCHERPLRPLVPRRQELSVKSLREARASGM